MGNSDYARVAEAIRFLARHAEDQPSLASLAAHLGLSESRMHRLFRHWAGVTPKDFVQALTLVRARRLLQESHSLLTTSLAVGLSGPGRLHDLFVGLEAMTPGEYKSGGAGLSIRWGIHPTLLGDALVALTARGVCAFQFLDGGGRQAAQEFLARQWPLASVCEDVPATLPIAAEVNARMQGRVERPLSLALRGTAFQFQVWQALLDIPEGSVVTYGALAARLGAPGSSRAVGTAVGANPVGFLIPCHRVIRATGVLGGYRWGGWRKEALLAVEGARARLSSLHGGAALVDDAAGERMIDW